MIDLVVKPLTAPFQKTIRGQLFPLVLGCQTVGADLESAAAWVRANRNQLDDQLKIHTAIVWRAFPLKTAEDFDAMVAAFGYEGFAYKDSLSNAVRVNFTERVFSANEAPCTFNIELHHEMAQTPIYPSKLFFFCQHPADTGGATALCRSDELHDILLRELPEFMSDCETKGLRYTNIMPADNDPTSGLGRSWQSTFGVDSHEGAETRMRQLHYDWEWRTDGALRTSTPVLPAVRALDANRKSFFNQLIAAFKGWKDARNDPTKSITFGDGSPMNAAAVYRAAELADTCTVDVAWQAGDLCLLDNYAAMHGRRPFTGQRKVLASLVRES